MLWSTILFAAAANGALELELTGATGKRVTGLHLAANAEFFRPGIAAGVTTHTTAFRQALAASGIRALRFPGGNPAYYYLPESREATMGLAHAVGHWEFREDAPPSNRFVSLEDLARLCSAAGVQLIYELPCLFYLGPGGPKAIIRSSMSDKSLLYDRDRITAGVAYGMGIVTRLRGLGAPVAAWELGNEEFAHCDVDGYARVVSAYLQALGRAEPGVPVIVVGMGKGWLPELAPKLKQLGTLDLVHSFQVHYPYGHWPGPGSSDRRGDPAAFVGGDLAMERFLDSFRTRAETLGIADKPTSVTETMAMRHKNWDPHAIVPTHAHALCFAWNWMTLLERPEVDIAVFHDLETPFFGMLRYDVGYDAGKKRFVWLEAAADPEELSPRFEDQYVLSPTCSANRLLSELVGEDLVATNVPRTRDLRVLASRERILLVNRSPDPRRVSTPFQSAEAEGLTADRLGAVFPGSFRTRELTVRAEGGRTEVVVPAWSVAVVRRGRGT